MLEVEPGGEGCAVVVGPNGGDALCASAGKTVVGLRAQPQGTACPLGGRAVSWGSDANGNGLLEPSELEGNTYVCRAGHVSGRAHRAMRKALVRTTPLAPRNGHCPAGGTLVQSGVDRDGDGDLAPGEVERATFACNRFGGPALEALVDVTDAAPGRECANGGKRIRVGHEGESDRVSYVCDAR